MVKGSWIKPGAVIIDVGINPVEVSEIVFLRKEFLLNPLVVLSLFTLDDQCHYRFLSRKRLVLTLLIYAYL